MVRLMSTTDVPGRTDDRRSSLDAGRSRVDDVRPMTDADFDAIVKIDRDVFGADRRALLEMCRREANEYAWTSNGGYVFGRHGHTFEQIGPLVADDESDARLLVDACVSAAADRPCIVDVPVRVSWNAWLESAGFTPQRPFTRMRRGAPRYQEQIERMFAITGPEFG
jgi:hypothetical protein